jgi:glycerate kinase
VRLLIAPQEFKGTLSAVEAAAAMRDAIAAAWPAWELDVVPMADGGSGTVAALLAARGGEARTTVVNDPLLRPVEATWGLLPDGTAVVEWAAASGLWRLRPDELDPRRASSYGTGELLRLALDEGSRSIVLGLGGSATNDGGAGCFQALGYRFLAANGVELPPGGAALARLHRIDASGAHPGIAGTRILGATDVTNPLLGHEGASATYGPQKGADAAAVAELDAALSQLADVVERDLGVDIRTTPGAGSAGGAGGGVIAFLGVTLRSGAEVVAEAAGLEARVHAADLVITGEGRLDGQTSFGKGPLHVARLAKGLGRPVVCITGSLGPGHERLLPWFDAVRATSAPGETLPSPDEAARQAGEAVLTAVLELLTRRRVGLV